MKTQIPIYRAKKICSDEYVEFETKVKSYGEVYAVIYKDDGVTCNRGFDIIHCDLIKIDPSTLAIHFPDRLDSEGTKIFASLSEDGKGGDIVEYMLDRGKKAVSVCRYKDRQIVYAQNNVKVIGIEQ